MLVAVEVEVGAEVEVEDEVGVEEKVEVEVVVGGPHLDFLGVLCGFPLMGTGLGSPSLFEGKRSVKCLIGGGRYDCEEEIVDKTEGVL